MFATLVWILLAWGAVFLYLGVGAESQWMAGLGGLMMGAALVLVLGRSS